LTFLKDDKADVINDEYFKTITALIAKYGLAKDNESVTDILLFRAVQTCYVSFRISTLTSRVSRKYGKSAFSVIRSVVEAKDLEQQFTDCWRLSPRINPTSLNTF
jgi:hypothetical protein